MKKVIGIVGAASVLSLFVGFASADQGGVPNDNACLGQATSAYAQANNGAGAAVKEQAQNDDGPGRSAEVHAFKTANCPADPSAN